MQAPGQVLRISSEKSVFDIALKANRRAKRRSYRMGLPGGPRRLTRTRGRTPVSERLSTRGGVDPSLDRTTKNPTTKTMAGGITCTDLHINHRG
jgi:hypothetical protein